MDLERSEFRESVIEADPLKDDLVLELDALELDQVGGGFMPSPM